MFRWERVAVIAGFVMRQVGPLLRGNRVARANLTAAFPEKSKADIDQILRGVWTHFGRMPVEMASIDLLWDYDLDRDRRGRILVDQTTRERLLRLRQQGGPVLCFGAHLGNWELLAVAMAALGFDSAAVYRSPPSMMLADELLRLREPVMGKLISAGRVAALEIDRELRQSHFVGMLVDEHAPNGAGVEFFGRRCLARPTIARFARLFDCPIHGGRVIRLPNDQFKFELTDAVEPVRDKAGKIDIAMTMQDITSIIESWIRETPEQWLWMQRRWR